MTSGIAVPNRQLTGADVTAFLDYHKITAYRLEQLLELRGSYVVRNWELGRKRPPPYLKYALAWVAEHLLEADETKGEE
jgi:hypothetical protein